MDSQFAMPADLSPAGQRAWQAIVTVLVACDPQMKSGGCTAFYSPKRWREREEWYGTDSELVVVYDGGDHRYHFEDDGYGYEQVEHMRQALEAAGFYFEACTGWYGAVYRI